MLPQSEATCAVLFAEGYTGMTLMQELAARIKDFEFKQFVAIVDKERKAETRDIQAMNSELFKVDHYDASDHSSITTVLGKYRETLQVIILIPPAQERKLECVKLVCSVIQDDIVQKNLKCLLVVSSILTETCGQLQNVFNEFIQIEDMCKEACPKTATCTIVRPGFYAQNLLLYTPQIQNGELPLPIGTQRMNIVDLADVGYGMAELLTQILRDMKPYQEENQQPSSKYHEQAIDLLGTQMLSGTDLASMLTKCTGKEVKYKDISNNEAAKLLSMTNLIDPYEANYLLAFYTLVKQGKLESVMENSAQLENNMYWKMTKLQPTLMEEFLTKYKQELVMPVHPGAFKRGPSGAMEE